MLVKNSARQNNVPGIQFARRSFLLITSNLLKLAVQLGILFVYARSLSILEYGIYQSVWLYVNVLSIFALFGLPSVILSSPVYNIKSWIRQNKLVFFLMAFLLNILPVLYILFGPVDLSMNTRFILIVLTLVQNISIVTETFIIKNEKELKVLGANIIFTLGYFISHLVILKNGYSLNQLLWWLTLLFIVKTMLLWNYKNTKAAGSEKLPVQTLGKQWLYLGLFDVISVVFKWVDKWLILFFLSISEFAVYFNGSYEVPVFAMLVSAVGNILLVEFSRLPKPDPEKIRALFIHSSFILAAIVYPSFCFLFFYYAEFFTLLFGTKYPDAIPIFFVTIFVLPVRITNFTAALQVYHRNDLVVKGALLDLVIAIIFMTILYPLLQLRGLALAFVLSTYVQAAYYLWHTSKLLEKNVGYFFPFKKLLIILLVSFIITAATYYAFYKIAYPYNLISGIIVCLGIAGSLLGTYLMKQKQI